MSYVTEKTEVLSGEKTVNGLLSVLSNVSSKVNIFGDSTYPLFLLNTKQIKEKFIDFKRRGINSRFITEITLENITYCKELIQYIELRHLDQIKGNGIISETEYIVTTCRNDYMIPTTQAIYSNIETILVQNQHLFETLWDKSIPANQVINEIGKMGSEFVEVIYDFKKIMEKVENLLELAKHEIQLILPSNNSIILLNGIGIIDKLKRIS